MSDSPLQYVLSKEEWDYFRSCEARMLEMEEGIRQHLAHHENGCVYLSHLVAPNAEVSGERSESAATQG